MPLKVKKVTIPTIAASVLFNGTSQYLTVANSSALQLNTGNFTIEGWIYATAFQASSAGNDLATVCDKDGIQGSTYSSYSVRCTNSSGVIKLKVDCNTSSGGGTTGAVTSTTTINTGTWYHFAYVRNGATAYLYINGTQEASAGIVDFYTTTNPVYIGYGNNSVSRFYWPGYISNFRIVKGTAVYTSSFSIPTTPLTAITSCSLLTCNDQTIRDASVNNFTVTNNNTATVSTVTPFTASLASSMKFKKTSTGRIGRSVQFSGNGLNGNYATSQYLYTPVSTIFDPGTNTPWTIEFWVYPITACAVLNISTSTNYGNSLWISWASSFFNWGQGNSAGSNPINVNTAASYPANNWYHVSICKDSSYTSRMFINGTEVLSSTYNSSLGSPNRLIVNGQWDNAGYSYGGNCYVSNVRWIKGTGLYTASFSVPTSPLTAITNTQLLICNGPTIVDSSPNNFTITNKNAATASATNPFGADTVLGTFKVKKSAGVYMVATGGDLITTSGSYKVHTFTTVGTSSFTISSIGSTPSIEYLIVGGGGGGGAGRNCGGGGAGGLIYNTASLSVGTYTITIGQSGSAAIATNPAAAVGGNGGNSTFNGLVALGGGGGSALAYANNGGSGGGGFLNPTNGIGLQPTSSYGGFGNNGGSNVGGGGYGAGGGGGAGAVGADGTSSTGGNGGNGKAYVFAGASTYYAGGGGGAVNPGTPGTGGLGGGGAGINTNFGTPVNATGYGSGGGGGLNASGGAGSAGIILIKYRYTD